MNATVQKWGNSLALRIPNSLAKDVRLHQGSVVEVVVEEGKMVIKPKGRHKYSLVQLIRKVTKSNRHGELGWGGPVGQEIW